MTLSIEIDEEVFAALQSRARPFVDSPNDVLRRTFGLDDGSDIPGRLVPPDGVTGPGHATTGKVATEMTPQKAFRRHIVDILNEHDGRAHMHDVLGEVEARMEDSFKPGDLMQVSTGEVRWRNATRWERWQMVKEGLIRKGTAAGWWELTSEGRKA
jgi:hypothetical protein